MLMPQQTWCWNIVDPTFTNWDQYSLRLNWYLFNAVLKVFIPIFSATSAIHDSERSKPIGDYQPYTSLGLLLLSRKRLQRDIICYYHCNVPLLLVVLTVACPTARYWPHKQKWKCFHHSKLACNIVVSDTQFAAERCLYRRGCEFPVVSGPTTSVEVARTWGQHLPSQDFSRLFLAIFLRSSFELFNLSCFQYNICFHVSKAPHTWNNLWLFKYWACVASNLSIVTQYRWVALAVITSQSCGRDGAPDSLYQDGDYEGPHDDLRVTPGHSVTSSLSAGRPSTGESHAADNLSQTGEQRAESRPNVIKHATGNNEDHSISVISPIKHLLHKHL